MTVDEFVDKQPELYHMCECNSWTSIQKYGLLSVSALLDLYEYDSARRNPIESQWRPRKVRISHPQHGTAVIRDQKPMPPDALKECLIEGITPSAWYELLNSRIFFWVGTERLNRMLTANAYINQVQWVITVGTRALLERYANRVSLTAFNTGFAFDKRPRGINTFKSLDDWPRMREVAELAVDFGITDIAEITKSVVEWKGVRENNEKVCKRLRDI